MDRFCTTCGKFHYRGTNRAVLLTQRGESMARLSALSRTAEREDDVQRYWEYVVNGYRR